MSVIVGYTLHSALTLLAISNRGWIGTERLKALKALTYESPDRRSGCPSWPFRICQIGLRIEILYQLCPYLPDLSDRSAAPYDQQFQGQTINQVASTFISVPSQKIFHLLVRTLSILCSGARSHRERSEIPGKVRYCWKWLSTNLWMILLRIGE